MVTRDLKGCQEVTGGYKRLQGVTCKWLQENTGG